MIYCDTLTIARVPQVGKVNQNRHLITRDTWEIAMKAYEQRRQKELIASGFELIPVTISTSHNHHDQIDPRTIVGFATRIGFEYIDVRFHSADTFAIVKELVLHEHYKAWLRSFGKLREKKLTDLEKEFYGTKADRVTELYDLRIICFDLVSNIVDINKP